MVNGGDNWEKGGQTGTALQVTSGTHIALLPGVQTKLEVHGLWDLIQLSIEWVGRMLWSRLNPCIPKWVAADGHDLQEGELVDLLQDIVDGKLKPVLDPSSPFEFTDPGVKKALELQKSRHAHGKVVIHILQ
jgi:NADPH:quinone reductase-like Zn-dependent oxidoreductase